MIPLLGAAIATVASSAIGAITGASRAKKADKDIRAYEEKINNFKRQELSNVYRGLTVPTKRAELMQEEQARTAQSAISGASLSGARGLASTLPQIMDYQNKAQNDIAAFYEEQQNRIDQLIAQDDTRIQGMKENRDNMELQGLQAGLSSAMGQKQAAQDLTMGSIQSGLGGLVNIGGQMATNDLYSKIYGLDDKTLDKVPDTIIKTELPSNGVKPLDMSKYKIQIPTQLPR